MWIEFALERPGRLSFAKDFGRHALTNFALGVAVFQEDVVGMRMHVDEAGSNDQSLGVDLAASRARRHPADSDNVIAANCGVAAEPRVAAAIHDRAVANQQVVSRLGRPRYSGSEEQAD